MKTNINFYTDALKPKVYYLTLTNIAAVGSIALLGMVIWFSTIYFKSDKVIKHNEALKLELDLAQVELTNYQQALIKHNDGATFKKQQTFLERQVRAKSMLLQLVTAQSSKDAIDYSKVMQELTEHHDHDLWLKEFSFNNKSVVFQGYALQSNAVTQWMTYLQQTESFKGREFGILDIKAINEDVVEFKTSTDLNTESEGASR